MELRSLILMYIECVPAMVAMTQILYGYYTKFDELGIQWNSGIWLRKYTRCGPTTCPPIAQNISDRKLWQSIAQKYFGRLHIGGLDGLLSKSARLSIIDR